MLQIAANDTLCSVGFCSSFWRSVDKTVGNIWYSLLYISGGTGLKQQSTSGVVGSVQSHSFI